MTFGQRLKAEQNRLGVSQKEICSILYNLPIRSLQSWYRGERSPPRWVQEIIIFYLRQKKSKESNNLKNKLKV